MSVIEPRNTEGLTPIMVMPDWSHQLPPGAGNVANASIIFVHYLDNPYFYYKLHTLNYTVPQGESMTLNPKWNRSADGHYFEVELDARCPAPSLIISGTQRPTDTKYAATLQYQLFAHNSERNTNRWYFEGCFPSAYSPYNDSVEVLVHNPTTDDVECTIHVGAFTARSKERRDGNYGRLMGNDVYSLKFENGLTRVVERETPQQYIPMGVRFVAGLLA